MTFRVPLSLHGFLLLTFFLFIFRSSMKTFTLLQRTITFFIGFFIVLISIKVYSTSNIFSAICLFLFGLYIVIASLIPHQTVVDEVSVEPIWYLFVTLPLRIIGKIIEKVIELFDI